MSKVYDINKLIELRTAGNTLKSIGNRYNLTSERIRQLVGYIKQQPKYPHGFKRCYGCRQTLPETDFYLMEGQNNRCKKCLKIMSSKYAKLNIYKYKSGGIYFKHAQARTYVEKQIYHKKIVKPSICEINKDCYGRIEGHHYLGYEKEHWLDIRWLCSKHHQLADKGLI